MADIAVPLAVNLKHWRFAGTGRGASEAVRLGTAVAVRMETFFGLFTAFLLTGELLRGRRGPDSGRSGDFDRQGVDVAATVRLVRAIGNYQAGEAVIDRRANLYIGRAEIDRDAAAHLAREIGAIDIRASCAEVQDRGFSFGR